MDLYPWVKALHVASVISWMAGLFYLPRLFVYHAEADPVGDAAAIAKFKVMELKLLRVIMNPAMLASWATGLILAWQISAWTEGWFHVKAVLLIAMTAFHMALAAWRKGFEAENNTRTGKFYRFANEIPTVLMLVIVVMVVVKPF